MREQSTFFIHIFLSMFPVKRWKSLQKSCCK